MAQKSFQISFAGKPVEQTFYGDMVMLRVEENTGTANSFQLRIASKLGRGGSWNYLDDRRFELFTPVSIKAGFSRGAGLAGALGAMTDGPSGSAGNEGLIPLLDGFVTGVQFEAGSEASTAAIEVSGMDATVLMSLEEKIATWKNMSDSAIAAQILKPYVARVETDNTSTTHQDKDTTIMQRSSDARFVRELAERNGLEFYVETDPATGKGVAYFHAPQLDGPPQPGLAMQFGDQSNLVSFSARITGHRPVAVKVAQIDIETNAVNTAQVTDTKLAKLGKQDANALIGGPLPKLVRPADTAAQMLFLGPPTSNQTELQTIAQAVRDEAGWFIAAHGEINSDAYRSVLRPHRLVQVRGAGKTHSGTYYVTKVVHEFGGDGSHKQTFEARRNGRDVNDSEQFGGGGLGLPAAGV
jgi:phage protein D